MTQQLHDQLIAAIPALPAKDQNFASDLCKGFRKFGSWTDRQLPHVKKLIERATAPASAPKDKQHLDLTGINTLFDNARASGMKRMSLRFKDEQGNGFAVSPAKAESRNPGCLYVKSAGGSYLGKITKEGEFQGANYGEASTAVLAQAALIQFNKDPVGQAKIYGHETGSCCFCGLELTDARSVTAGYGPICAERWGLDWGSKSRSASAV